MDRLANERNLLWSLDLKDVYQSNGQVGKQKFLMTCSMSPLQTQIRYNLWAPLGSSTTFFGRKLSNVKQPAKIDYKPFPEFKVTATQTTEEKGLSNADTLRSNFFEKNHGYMARKYHFHATDGSQVRVVVSKIDSCYRVSIEVSSSVQGKELLIMKWGLFQSSSSDWVTFDSESVPAGTARVGESMQTPFNQVNSGVYSLELELRSSFAPFYISFVLYQLSGSQQGEVWIRNVGDSNFCIPVGFGRGRADILGATLQRHGSMNFALYARHAVGVILCLYDAESRQPSLELELYKSIHRTGNIWHIELDDVSKFTRYGYRCQGETTWERGNRFHARRILLDPYAKLLAPFVPGQDSLPSPAPMLGLLTKDQLQFDWEDDVHPDIPLENIMAYRLNITSFTCDKSSGLAKDLHGTFDGLVEKLQHFKNLGINAIILQPIFTFQKEKGSFYPLSFFAPMDSFGPLKTSMSSSYSLKKMVKELHRDGIEVLLDVVYTHTGENNDEAPETISFRGIDNATYYILSQDGRVMGRESEAGNCFNCNHSVVQKLILDSLRHWVMEYHIDGFCFANASFLTRGPHGEELSRPLIVEMISFDPLLSRRKIIADTSYPFTGVNKVFAFPHWKRWCLSNHRYRDDVRRFIRGDKEMLSSFATRLCGSGDIVADGRGPSFSLNFITSTYGLTLVDLVSYSTHIKVESEWSWNCGEEGRTLDQEVLNIRLKNVRNFLMCLFLSQGIPVLTMGDEYGHSKGGSIPIDQRRAFNWDALNLKFGRQMTHLITSLATFRVRRKDLLQRKDFLKLENIRWHGSQPDEPQWDSSDSSFLAVSLRPDQGSTESQSELGDIYIGFNPKETPVLASLPEAPVGMIWYRIADTSLPYPEYFVESGFPISTLKGEASTFATYEVQSHSSILLEARAVQ